MNKKELTEIAERINTFLITEHKLFADFEDVRENNQTITFHIEWGDWKHEHLAFDYLVKNYLKDYFNLECYISTEVTEDTDTDCYSAYHIIHLASLEKEIQIS